MVRSQLSFDAPRTTHQICRPHEIRKNQTGFLKKLFEDNPKTLRIIGFIAGHVWEAEAAHLLLERLEKNFTIHCSPLVEALGKLPIDDDDQPSTLRRK